MKDDRYYSKKNNCENNKRSIEIRRRNYICLTLWKI